MDKPWFFDGALPSIVWTFTLRSVRAFIYKCVFCASGLASEADSFCIDVGVHYRHGIHCWNHLYKRNENKVVGLFKLLGKHQRYNLPAVFILLDNFERALLLFHSSTDSGMALLVHEPSYVLSCDRIFLRRVHDGRVLHLQYFCKNP